MPNTLNDKDYLNINQKAQRRFYELKRKMKLDLGLPFIEQAIEKGSETKVKIDRDRIEALLKGEIKSIPELDHIYAKQEPKFVKAYDESLDKLSAVNENIENIFEWIDSLGLDPKLALAIGMIISYKNTRNIEDLQKAIESLEGEINGRHSNNPS